MSSRQMLAHRVIHAWHLAVPSPCKPANPLARRHGLRRFPRANVSAALPNEQDQPSQSQSSPPPPPPEPPQAKQSNFEDNLARFVDQTRDIYLPASFVLGTSTFGLKTSLDNFVLQSDPLGFIGCALMSGAITSALAWILFDFIDTPKK
ncbi:hypothetical protein DUNSADRAFT_17789 [Dunaliella salina]|uniref:Uncharacterized protein n=1 Tax=Dunaliella salina TaxID=3046 RepID=A0ABQ7G129_DUNSA|nr:hypothetical protein DUNSADRAFT_17789 [Dunaliella salina]|eukprot:KAF5828305.1 hypothetical protein DUNSADRAFT_17789 [Dunaliella salina]